MALSNGAGGYQLGDGNVGEPLFSVIPAPTAIAAAATMTPAQLAGGMFVFDGAAGNLALPTVADFEAAFSSASKIGSSFDFAIVNIDGGGDDVTLTTGTGWTIVGVAKVDDGTSAIFRARKTADGAWTAYRIS